MTRYRMAALMVVVTLGGALRGYRLDRESLWTDEVFSVDLARHPWPSLLAATNQDTHPPLYAAVLKLWISAFGEGEAAVRGLSALIAVATLPALFVLAVRLLSVRAALLATLLLACSPYHVYYAQEARNYALLVLLTILSYVALVAWDTQPRPGRAAAYVLVTTLLLYTHVFAFFVWAAQILWVLGRGARREERLARVVPFIVIALLVTPWIAGPWKDTLLRQTDLRTTGLRLARPGLSTLAVSLYQFAGSPLAAVVLLPAAGLEAYRGLTAQAGREDGAAMTVRRRTTLLLLWAAVPQLVPLAASQLAVPIYITRATIVTLPALILLAAAFLARLGGRPRALLATVVVLSSLAAQATYFRSPTKEQWREVASTVDARARAGDVVVFDVGYGRSTFDYYSRSPALRKIGLANDLTTAAGAAELTILPADAQRLWVVRFHRPPGGQRVIEALSTRYRLGGSAAYQGIELFLFEKAGD